MRSYSYDLRIRILEAYQKNKESSTKDIANQFDVNVRTVQRLIKQYNENGHVEAKPPNGGSPYCIDEKGLDILEDLVIAKQDLTLKEYSALFEELTGQKVDPSTIWRALKRLGYSFKKKSFVCRRAGS